MFCLWSGEGICHYQPCLTYHLVIWHSHGKSPFLIGKPFINGPFSMAMFNNQRVSNNHCISLCLQIPGIHTGNQGNYNMMKTNGKKGLTCKKNRKKLEDKTSWFCHFKLFLFFPYWCHYVFPNVVLWFSIYSYDVSILSYFFRGCGNPTCQLKIARKINEFPTKHPFRSGGFPAMLEDA